jgi:hypothetical protein
MNGLILWEGNSRIDDRPIVAIITGLEDNSTNKKTGPMAQTWIIGTSVHPHEAIDTGDDVCVCGNCPLRKQSSGVRLCYVPQMPLGQIYRCFHAGVYPEYQPSAHADLLRFRYAVYGLRIGSYGDPAAVPSQVWLDQIELARKGRGWTGYTRRWMHPENQIYRDYLMASCFSIAEQQEAIALGWRTYRIKGIGEANLIDEISCPGSIEMDHSTICANCHLCDGAASPNAPSITIQIHGGQSKHWSTTTVHLPNSACL